MKPSEWIELNLDSHFIYAHNDLAEDFTKETGMQPCWIPYTAGTLNHTYGKPKGILSVFSKDLENVLVISGYEVAIETNKYFGGKSHRKFNGKGSQFRAAIKELKENNF